MTVTAEDVWDVSEYLWPANPKRYNVSYSYSFEPVYVMLEYDDLEELTELVYSLMDAIQAKGTGGSDDEWAAVLNLIGHMQRWTIPEYWTALRARCKPETTP